MQGCGRSGVGTFLASKMTLEAETANAKKLAQAKAEQVQNEQGPWLLVCDALCCGLTQDVTDVTVDVLFRQITACLQLRPACTCQAAADKEKAIKDAEATKKKAEALLFNGQIMGSMWSTCKDRQQCWSCALQKYTRRMKMPALYVQADKKEAIAKADAARKAAEEQVGSDAGIPMYDFSQARSHKTRKLEWQRRVPLASRRHSQD